MDDVEFDELLRSSALSPSASTAATAVLLAEQVRDAAHSAVPLGRPRSRRGRVVASAVAAGALVLTGAGTLTAYQMSLPPFQSLEPGIERIQPGVPVEYTNSLGRTVRCLAFVEYQHLDGRQRAALAAALHGPRWDGYGQRVLDGLHLPDATPEAQNHAVYDVVVEDLRTAAHQAVPSLAHLHDSDGPVFHGMSTSCTEPGGVDGQ